MFSTGRREWQGLGSRRYQVARVLEHAHLGAPPHDGDVRPLLDNVRLAQRDLVVPRRHLADRGAVQGLGLEENALCVMCVCVCVCMCVCRRRRRRGVGRLLPDPARECRPAGGPWPAWGSAARRPMRRVQRVRVCVSVRESASACLCVSRGGCAPWFVNERGRQGTLSPGVWIKCASGDCEW